MKKAFALYCLVFLLGSTSLVAQVPHMEFGRFEVGGGVGTTLYKGDLTAEFRPEFMRAAFQGLFRHNVSKSVTLRYNLMYGRVFAKTEGVSPDPYLSKVMPQQFSSPLLDLTAGVEYNFFDFRREPLRPWSPYIFLGIGGFYFEPTAQEPGGDVTPVQPSLPFGVGLKFVAYRNWNVGVEFLTRKTFTDFLDNSSATTGGTPDLQRGNKRTMDWYSFTGINVTYTFAEVVCPKEPGGFIY